MGLTSTVGGAGVGHSGQTVVVGHSDILVSNVSEMITIFWKVYGLNGLDSKERKEKENLISVFDYFFRLLNRLKFYIAIID